MASSRPLLSAATLAVTLAASSGLLGLVGCTGGSTESSKPVRPAPLQPDEAMVGKALATVNGLPVGALAFDALAQRRSLCAAAPHIP